MDLLVEYDDLSFRQRILIVPESRRSPMNITHLPSKADMTLEDLFITVYCFVEESYNLIFRPLPRCARATITNPPSPMPKSSPWLWWANYKGKSLSALGMVR